MLEILKQLTGSRLSRGDASSISGRGQLQCSREVYKSMEQAWSLPHSVLKVLLFPGLHLAFNEENKIGNAHSTLAWLNWIVTVHLWTEKQHCSSTLSMNNVVLRFPIPVDRLVTFSYPKAIPVVNGTDFDQ